MIKFWILFRPTSYESGCDLINLQFNVHSANPVAAEQIRGLLKAQQYQAFKIFKRLMSNKINHINGDAMEPLGDGNKIIVHV